MSTSKFMCENISLVNIQQKIPAGMQVDGRPGELLGMPFALTIH